MNDKNKSNNFETLSERISNFEAVMTYRKKKRSQSQLPLAGMALAGRIATELLAGIVLGVFLGLLIDRWLETTPIFMLTLFFLGAAGGLMNVWRLVTGRGMSAGYFIKNTSKKEVKSPQNGVNKK